VARRSSWSAQAQRSRRDRERATEAQIRAQVRAQREAERTRKAYERASASAEKERKRLYVESQIAEVEALNAGLEDSVSALAAILSSTLGVDDYLDFEDLKDEPDPPMFQPGALAVEMPLPTKEDVPPLSWSQKLVPGAKTKHEQRLQDASDAWEKAKADHTELEAQRTEELARTQAEHDATVARIVAETEERNQEIDGFRGDFEAGKPEAIAEYFSLVLDSSSYPDGFPRSHRLAVVPESRQLVVEYELPALNVVPEVKAHRYVRARDAMEHSDRPAAQRRSIYAAVVAQVALRTLHELFEADRGEKIETVVLNGFVNTIAPATGKPVTPHLVTVRASRDRFLELDLAAVEPLACLKGLNASVSPNPAELVPVRPILEFNMVDRRFVEESDVLSTLDQRPNLMALSPSEFESLITNLFEKMGLETRQTQASRDGGVDCVAWDPRPIFGGKVVVQAKRYKNTVGVSAVRDLFGTLQNEGASKGILITTSGFGKASFEFADGKPIELLGGGNLLYLLQEHAEIEARIEPPDDWVDPEPDAPQNAEQAVERPDIPSVAGPTADEAQAEAPATPE
jgi:restriction system protein